MPSWFSLDTIQRNLLALGAQRLLALGIAGITIVATIVFGSVHLSRPDFITLYSGLSQQDVTRIGAALSEAGLSFDVSPEQSTVLVNPGDLARARMLLAEKGLPVSSSAGYELFDKLGSMGLTSFMQEVTRVRALEGELARSIQTLRGVRAARVHIVMPDQESFRRERRRPTASVVIKMESTSETTAAKAIQHLVAAAVPGMATENVQVVSTDGTILAAEGVSGTEITSKLIDLEKSVSKLLEDKVRKTLMPYLGADNFEISVNSKLNVDKQQTSETAFDPKSRVERSTRVVRQADNSQNTSKNQSVSVEQEVPGEDGDQAQSQLSKRSNERREELTNYEINSKQTSSESQGYRIEQLSVAVLVNRKRMIETAGSPIAGGSLEARLKELEALIKTSTGLDAGRGDQVTVMAVDFIEAPGQMEPAASRSITEILLEQAGSLIRALTILAVAGILIVFGVRPIVGALQGSEAPTPLAGVGLAGDGEAARIEGPAMAQGLPPPEEGEDEGQRMFDELNRNSKRSPNKRLEAIVNVNEEQAVAVLRQWLQQAKA